MKEESTIERSSVPYQNLSSRFVLSDRKFGRQFAHLYSVRLNLQRLPLIEATRKVWGSDIPVKKLYELREDDEKVIVVGTLYKEMSLKPCILKEISDEHYVMPLPINDRFTNEDDVLILEDELQRIVLIGECKTHFLVTGIVVAVLGYVKEGGKFYVEDMCFSVPSKVLSLPKTSEDRYVILISGLGFGSSEANSSMNLDLLAEMVNGNIGSEEHNRKMASVTRVIIAGGSLSGNIHDKNFTTKARYLTKNTRVGSIDAVKNLDEFLLQLVNTIHVDIMPGENDPSNHMVPQQPLHPCMFPLAGQYKTFHSVSNPYEANIGGIRFLGTSGQNVDDIFRYSNVDDRLEILETTLNWGHMMPTAPDTLSCYPYYDKDPFILNECPNVYFAGNQSKFQTSKSKGVRYITIPKFSETGTCVMVNLKNLECELLTIDSSFLSK